ncbi:retrovirus-related pol polyprotein from transposon TNT 1-94 [Tanacetum coccineum]
MPRVKKPKKVGFSERLASPKPSKPRMCLRWSPTGKMFDIKGNLIASSESNGDNACTSNPQEPTIKRLPNSTSSLGRNDHVAAIMGFDDLQWGNILITKVYFIEGLGHNLFSVGQFYDSDLEVAFRRNTCFVRNLEGVDLLKGNRTTNLYTNNLHDIASTSPICLMALATSTKSWLWHQRLSHLNFDTINDLARNDLVIGLPKSNDETPEVIKTFLKRITVLLQSPVIIVRTDNDAEFKNQVLKEYFYSVVISHQSSSVRTPQQNGVVERRNRTLVKAARTMLIFSRAPLFLWAEAIATACYTQNRSIIHRRFNKTPYELINGIKLDISFLHNVQPKDKEIMETMNVIFDELSAMAFEQSSSKPGLQSMTSGQISSGLDLTYAPSTITSQQLTKGELDLLFEAIYDDHIGGQPSATPRTVPATQHQPATIANNVPNAMFDENTFVNPFATPSTSAAESSSSQYVDPSNMHTFHQPYPHEYQWTKDHPLEQVIGEPSRPVLTRNQLRSVGDMCMYALTVSTMEPKNVKEAMTDPAWIESMQEELLQFKRIDVWVLVPTRDNIKPLTLKWLFKNKHDEENTIIQNKTRLVVRG